MGESSLNIIPWDLSLETGIEILDEQHKNFIKKANLFFIKFKAEKKSDAVIEQMGFLEDYLFYHFQTEEAFQIDSHYPEFPSHQAEHKQLIFKVKAMAEAIRSMTEENQDEVYQQFVQLVNQWIGNHIMNSDMKFTRYYTTMFEEE